MLLGLALATTFFKNKFTAAERDAGKTNYIMGASFITEGAIPFAAAALIGFWKKPVEQKM